MAEQTLPLNAGPVTDSGRIPTVVVDDVHVIYRIHKGASGGTTPVSALKRIVSRTKAPNIREVHAVKGVSFTAYQGEAIGLIGSNGSGKSTLLRAIAGLLPPARGAVYTQGQPSLLGVNAALLNDLSGERNVVLGCLAMGMHPDEVKRIAPEIIEFSGINERGDFASLPMRTYSSGMGARLRFAIAVGEEARRAAHRRGAGHRRPQVPVPQRAAGPRAAGRAPAPCSWSATRSARSGTPASGPSGWRAAS